MHVKCSMANFSCFELPKTHRTFSKGLNNSFRFWNCCCASTSRSRDSAASLMLHRFDVGALRHIAFYLLWGRILLIRDCQITRIWKNRAWFAFSVIHDITKSCHSDDNFPWSVIYPVKALPQAKTCIWRVQNTITVWHIDDGCVNLASLFHAEVRNGGCHCQINFKCTHNVPSSDRNV